MKTLLCLAALLWAQLLPVPPTPRVNGLMTTRVDPKEPYVTLEWNAREVAPRVSGIDWELSLGPFPDKNPDELTEKPIKEGHCNGESGNQRLDLSGLRDGEYFLRYQAVGPTGKPASLASDPVRLVIITGYKASGGTHRVVRLVPDRVTIPLGSVQKFWPPEGATAVSWQAEGGGTVDATGVYLAPAEMPGNGLTAYARVTAVLSDGRKAEAEIVLARPPRIVEITPIDRVVKSGGTVQLRVLTEGATVGAPVWALMAGGGELTPDGRYTAPKVTTPSRVQLMLVWPGVTQGTPVELTILP